MFLFRSIVLFYFLRVECNNVVFLHIKGVYLHQNKCVMSNEMIIAVVAMVLSLAAVVLLALIYCRLGQSGRMGDGTCKSECADHVAAKVVLPLKVQAYERLLLFLERIQFHILVKRVYTPGMANETFRAVLAQNVREEFEHNMAQRLYVSNEAWQMINYAVDNVLHQMNEVFGQLTEENDSAEAAQMIIKLDSKVIDSAIARIKIEFDALAIS